MEKRITLTSNQNYLVQAINIERRQHSQIILVLIIKTYSRNVLYDALNRTAIRN